MIRDDQKNFGLFVKTRSHRRAEQFLMKTFRSDKILIKIDLSKICDGTHHQKKRHIKPKFFLQISDHHQSIASLSLRRAFIILPTLRKVADLKVHNFPFADGIIETDDQIFNLFNGTDRGYSQIRPQLVLIMPLFLIQFFRHPVIAPLRV